MKKRSELQSEYVYRIVEDMDMDTLVLHMQDFLHKEFDKYTEEELVTDVRDFYPDLLED